MTTKERIYTALMGQMPDRVPFTTYRGAATAEDGYDDLIAKGMGFMASCHVYSTRHPNVEVTHEDETLDGVPARLMTYRTPVGEIRGRYRREPGYGSDWRIEHFIKDAKDYNVLEFIIHDTEFSPNYDEFRRTKVISINFPSSVHITEPEEIRDTTIQLLREAAPGNGFIIGVTENIPKSVGTRSLEVIMDTVNEYGNCPVSDI